MNLNISNYTRFYKQAFKVFQEYCPFHNDNSSIEDKLKEQPFSSLMELSPGIFMIADIYNLGYAYISDSIKSVLGYDREDFYTHGLVKTSTIFPKHHNEIIIGQVLPIMFEIFEKHSATKTVKDLQVSYNSLIIAADGTSRWFNHKINVLHTDENNKARYLLKLLIDIHDIKKDDSIAMTVSQKNEYGVYKTIFSRTFHAPAEGEVLSSRELEILNLISHGKNSAEIADMLFISKHTVFKHRKNMLKKMHVKTTGELLKKSIANSFI